MTQARISTARRKRIAYWGFYVEITGPGYRTRAGRRRIHRILSRKRLKELEQLAKQAVQSKLPHGFRAQVN